MATIVIPRRVIEDVLESANIYDDEASIREDYSGRYMYGHSCFGITFSSMSAVAKFMFYLGICLIEIADDFDVSEFDEYQEMKRDLTTMVDRIQFDSMGLGTIIYFPRCELSGV